VRYRKTPTGVLTDLTPFPNWCKRRNPSTKGRLKFFDGEPSFTETEVDVTRIPSAGVWYSSQFKNNHLAEMCSGSEAGSYLRLIDFVYHSTLGLRVIKTREEGTGRRALQPRARAAPCSSPRCAQGERVLYQKPAGPKPLYHRDDWVDRPRALGVRVPFSR